MARIVGKIRTSDGFLVDPFNPTLNDIKPHVFIHAICCLNRFTGHASHPYSVGQHSLILAKHVPGHIQRAAVVHDFGEAWFNDIASPVKAELPQYKKHEHAAMLFIAQSLGVGADELLELDYYDKQIYLNERNALFPVRHGIGPGDDRSGLPIAEWHFYERNWRDVRSELIAMFAALFPEYGVR